MTTETEAPAAAIEVVICPGCGTLYRRTAERIWCPNCSADGVDGFDLNALIDRVTDVVDGLDLLIGALAAGLRVDPGDLLDVLPKALETLVVPTRARPPVARPSRRGPNLAPEATPANAPPVEPEPGQGGAGVDAAAAESADDGSQDLTGSGPTAAAAEPETGT